MLSFIFNLFTRSLVVLLVAMLSVNYLPDKLFHDFNIEPKTMEPNDFDSVIPQWNNKLSDGSPEFIQLNNIVGPESLAISKDGLIYTGLADGRLIELDPSKNYKIRQVLRMKDSPACKDNFALRADECGRILQVRFVNNTLYAIDANTGLYKIDIKAGTKTHLGPKPLSKVNLYNSFAFDSKNPQLAYISVSSTKWDILNIMWSLMELDGTGQVIALDVVSGKRVIVLDNLLVSNGIDVDGKRDQLVLSKTLKGRIHSMSLSDIRAAFKLAKDGDKLKNIEKKLLIPLLPGNPDNIVIEGDLAYIALPFVRQNGKDLVDKSAVVEYNLATGASRFFGPSTSGFVSRVVPDHKGNLLLGSFRSPFIVKQKI